MLPKVCCIVLALSPLTHAANTFIAPRRVSLAGHDSALVAKAMPTTEHTKTAGEGYAKGSPLYDKQQDRKKQGVKPVPPPPGTGMDGVPAGVPPPIPTQTIGGPPPKASFMAVLVHNLTYWVMYVTLAMFCALVWMKCLGGRSVKGWRERGNSPNTFSYGLFSLDHCCTGGDHHLPICLCSWCCAPLRMADTYAKEPYPLIKGGFWVALFVLASLTGLAPLTGNLSIVLLLIMAIYLRNKMRRDYGIEHSKCSTCVEDCFVWSFCTFCAIAQEARQADFCVKENDPNPDKGLP